MIANPLPGTSTALVSARARPVRRLLAAMYLAGVVGLQVPASRPLFLALVPFNLLTSCALLLAFHADRNRAFWFYAALAWLVGFGVEVAGVKTGIIFGHYQYGPTLGTKLLDVPLLIGVNWLVLTYCVGVVGARWANAAPWQRAALGATLLTALDACIEPVAVRFAFWDWYGQAVPLRNYLAWWTVSFGLLLVFHHLPFRKANPLAAFLLLAQAAFFLAHWLLPFRQ